MKKYLIILAAAVAVPAHADNTFVAVLNSGQRYKHLRWTVMPWETRF